MTMETTSKKCEHLNFKCDAAINRLSKVEGGPITHYCADIKIACADCNGPFEFLGLPVGSSPYAATVSLDGLEMRAAITPQGEKPPAGLSGYRINFSHDSQ